MRAPQIAVSGYEFGKESFNELLDLLDGLGVRFLELWPHNVEGENPAAIQRMLSARNIRVSCVSATATYRLISPSQTEAAQEAILRSIRLAAELGAPYVTTYMGFDPGLDPDAIPRVYARYLEPCLREAARCGISILLENMFDRRGEDPLGLSPARRPEGMRQVAEAVGSAYFGITFDPCNFHIAGIEAYPYAYELLKEFIRNVHVKDVTKYSPILHGELGNHAHWRDSVTGAWLSVPVGRGAVNFGGLLTRLCEDGYIGYLTIDVLSLPSERKIVYTESVEFLRRHLNLIPKAGS